MRNSIVKLLKEDVPDIEDEYELWALMSTHDDIYKADEQEVAEFIMEEGGAEVVKKLLLHIEKLEEKLERL